MSYKALKKGYKPSGIFRAIQPFEREITKGIPELDEVMRLVDNLMVNDLQKEYYYKLNDILIEAVQAHKELLELDSNVYKKLIELMLPLSLHGQKALAALMIYDKLPNTKENNELLNKILMSLNPRWRMLWLEILKKPADFLELKHKGWGRRARRIAQTIIQTYKPFQIMKYTEHVKRMVRWAHLSETAFPDSTFIFKKFKKDNTVLDNLSNLYKEYQQWTKFIATKDFEDLDKIKETLKNSRLPYTILRGFLGKKVWHTRIFRQLLPRMTVWELVLTMKQAEKRGLMEQADILNYYKARLTPEALKYLRIDLLELFQAYGAVKHEATKDLLYEIICQQLHTLREELKKYLGNLKIGLAIDQSGSMEFILKNSLAIGFCLANGGAKKTKVATFSEIAYDLPMPEEPTDLIRLIDQMQPISSTSIGAGMHRVLEADTDMLIVVSDMEQNTPPFSDEVYKSYYDMHKRFPLVLSIKFTTDPKLAVGEIQAMHRGRWLNLGEIENCFTIRNTWDILKVIEYVMNKQKEIMKLIKEIQTKKKKKTKKIK